MKQLPSSTWIALALLLVSGSSTSATAQSLLTRATTLVIAPVPRDEAQVHSLAEAVRYANISVVYNTGDPAADRRAHALAELLRVERRPYDYDSLHEDEFAGWLLANVLPASGDRAVLVVAPAEVIPHVLKRATAVKADDFGRVTPSDLFTLTLTPSYVSLVRSKVEPARAAQ